MKTLEKETRKSIRKEASYVGWGLTLYTIISSGIVIFSILFAIVRLFLEHPEITEQDALYFQMMEQCEKSGTSSIIGVCVGTVFLFLFLRKKVTIPMLMQNGKKMKTVSFLQIFGIFLGAQTFFTLFSGLLEWGFNLFGYSALGQVESSVEISTTVSMFLYASVIGPIIEEIVYRGFVLRSLEKYGKLLAIVVSSILFGIMHTNIPQGFFAFGVGIVLAYVTVEYSIKWAMLLHVINNCIMSDVLGWLISRLNVSMQETVNIALLVIYGVIAIILLYKKRNGIKAYISNHKINAEICLCIFTSIGIFIFSVVEIILAFSMLEKI